LYINAFLLIFFTRIKTKIPTDFLIDPQEITQKFIMNVEPKHQFIGIYLIPILL